jgi:hypothetical protein
MIKRALALTVCSWPLFGAPVGNPSFPEIIEEGFFISRDSWLDLRFGYEGDFVGDARLEQSQESSGRVDNFAQNTNAGTATLNILDRIDIYGVFGSSKVSSEWRFSNAGINSLAELETLYSYLWGVGARGILFEWGSLSLGTGGRYERSHYDNVWLTINGASQPVSGTCLIWRDWQVDLDMSYKIEIFTPYVGVKYSNVVAELGDFVVAIANNGSGNNRFVNRSPVGVFIGCTLSTGRYFMLNVEGRLIDEEAVTIAGDLRF